MGTYRIYHEDGRAIPGWSHDNYTWACRVIDQLRIVTDDENWLLVDVRNDRATSETYMPDIRKDHQARIQANAIWRAYLIGGRIGGR